MSFANVLNLFNDGESLVKQLVARERIEIKKKKKINETYRLAEIQFGPCFVKYLLALRQVE